MLTTPLVYNYYIVLVWVLQAFNSKSYDFHPIDILCKFWYNIIVRFQTKNMEVFHNEQT